VVGDAAHEARERATVALLSDVLDEFAVGRPAGVLGRAHLDAVGVHARRLAVRLPFDEQVAALRRDQRVPDERCKYRSSTGFIKLHGVTSKEMKRMLNNGNVHEQTTLDTIVTLRTQFADTIVTLRTQFADNLGHVGTLCGFEQNSGTNYR